MNGPTSDVWIKPWVEYLKQQGVKFLTNAELVKINYKHNKITSVKVKHNGQMKYFKSNEYVLAINPFNTKTILRNSNMGDYIILLSH